MPKPTQSEASDSFTASEIYDLPLSQRLAWFRSQLNVCNQQRAKKKLDANLQRDLSWGWLTPYLIAADEMVWRRWQHWERTMLTGRVLDEPLPQIQFEHPQSEVRSHLEKCLDLIPNHGSGGWLSWSGWEYMNYFLDWLLYGLASPGQKELPQEPGGCQGASMRLYQYFDLNLLIGYPYDYFGDLMAEAGFGRSAGFYPTPMVVTEMMAKMLFLSDKDTRLETVCDPCVGTGRMLLSASNYSYRLYGQDINGSVIRATLVNFALYAPRGYRPIPFLDAGLAHGDRPCLDEQGETTTMSKVISDQLTEVGDSRPDVAAYLENTEHDSEEQWKFEPIKKRRKKSTGNDSSEILQGCLFDSIV